MKQKSRKEVGENNKFAYIQQTVQGQIVTEEDLSKALLNIKDDKIEIKKNGGGLWKPKVTDNDAKVLAIIQQQTEPLCNPFDSASVFFNDAVDMHVVGNEENICNRNDTASTTCLPTQELIQVSTLNPLSDRGDRARRSAGSQAMSDVWSASSNTLAALIARRATNVGRQTTSLPCTQHCFAGFLELLEEGDSASTSGVLTAAAGRPGTDGDEREAAPSPVKTRSTAKRAEKEQQTSAEVPSATATSSGAISLDVSTIVQRVVVQVENHAGGGSVGRKSSSFLGGVFRRIKSKVKLSSNQDTRAQSIREAEDIISVVEDVVKETVSVGDTETGGHRDGLPQLKEWTERKYWVGVGSERKFNVATLTPTAEAATLLAKEQDPGARDGRLNARFPQRVWSYVQDCGVLQIAAVDGATASRCDIRVLALKIKLLDNIRTYGYLFPTGVSWSVPLKTTVPFENAARDLVDGWNFQVLAVTPQVLDVYVREGAVCSLPVGGLRWGLADPDMALVSLDYTQGLTPVLWALQIVNSLPYPLLSRTEWFATNDHLSPDELKVTSFLRNEGFVSICSPVTKIVLLVSAPQKRVRIGGFDLPVVGVTRNGEVPPLVPADARNLVVGCLDCLMAHPVSLTDLFNRWAVARVSSQTVDWAEIDTYVSILTNRFVRQEEVDVRARGDRRTAWLPPAFRSARFGTQMLPPARHYDGEDEFDAGNAATALDQVVTDRLTSDDYPILTVGQWTNYAELATGLGWATVDQPAFNRASGRMGDSLPIDNVERAAFIRRAFEEYKAAACCADEILSPNAVGNLGPFWSVLVTDTGSGNGDTAEEIGYDLVNSAPSEAGLSWLVNTFEIPGIGLTGKRTPAGLWLSDHCSGLSAFKLAGTEEFNQMTGMGDWWVNDYFIQPISQQEDAPQVERGLMRLDLLDVAERDVLFAICPDGRVAPDFSYRIDTSIFQTLAVERGWSGLLPPPATLVGDPRPFGWGAQWLETTQTLPPIVYKTPVHASVYKGSGAQAIYKKFGLGKPVGRRKRGEDKGKEEGGDPEGGAGKPGDKDGKGKDFGDRPDEQPTAGPQQKAAPSAKTDAVPTAPAKPSGKAGAPTGKEATAPAAAEAVSGTQKPPPGGSGTGPAPKTGTTQEAADRNLDHRKPEDTA
ncbi:hypothetical protein ACJJTC_016498 [Scirpophaga incertulas]